MSEAKELEIRFVGDDLKLRRKIRNAVTHGMVRDLSWSKLPDFIFSTLSSILVIECKASDLMEKESFVNWYNQMALTSPLLYFSEAHGFEKQFLSYLTHLCEKGGAKVFVGQSGQKSLLHWLNQTSERDPSEVITSLEITDSGLTVVFADDASATISFSELKRLAETEEILLNQIRIAGDRSYVTVGIKKGEPVPIPHDILREYVSPGKTKRQKRTSEQRKLTAKNLGNRIREVREEARLSQAKLAEKMGKSRWTVIRIENGEYLPKVSDLQKLATSLNMEIENLLGNGPR